MTDSATRKWSRRKDARPTEIIAAALDVFAESGFAAARLDEVASRAGIVKGTLYRYYDTKEDLFRAVVQHAVAANLKSIEQVAAGFKGPIGELVPLLLTRAAEHMASSRVPALARLVISESRAFPDLARIWHDAVVDRVLLLLTELIRQGQDRGEVRPGDPELLAFSLVGPMVMALLFNEVFGSFSPRAPNMQTLAAQHAEAVLRGILV